MACLTDLPNELTLMIIPLVSPDDIESFTSTCKKIYNLAAKDLKRHRALKRQYAVYRHRYLDDTPRRCNVSQLVDKVFQEPRTALYIQELWVYCWFNRWATFPGPGTSSPEGVHMPFNQGTITGMRELVSRHVPNEEASKWMGLIESGNEDPIVALLLLLLPNLSTLKVPYEGQECLYGTLCRITKMKGPDTPLSRLRHVQISHTWYEGEEIELKIIELFAALPSVRFIHGLDAFAPNPKVDPDTDSPPFIPDSRLQGLTLTSCVINSERLYDLLKPFKALRSFTYDADNREILHSPTYMKFEPRHICSGLSDFARSTLESLTILSHNKKRKFLGDIRSFESLGNLHIETQLLLDKVDLHDDTLLVRALPPKLETLKLECSRLEDEQRIARWIFTLAELKTQYVPALREVEVITREGDKVFNAAQDNQVKECRSCKALVEACKRRGVHLLVDAFTTEEMKNLEIGERRTLRLPARAVWRDDRML